MDRTAKIERNTRETQIFMELNLDGSGKYEISTGIPFLNHMLELFSKHSLIDLKIQATGDTDVDDHHTAEDLGIVLGSCLEQALQDRKGITRYGSILLPMDETLSQIALDLGGRPYLVYKVNNERRMIKEFDVELIKEFFTALVTQAKMNLHIHQMYGDDVHHAYESVFKGFARAMRIAVAKDPRETGIPSSKGVL